MRKLTILMAAAASLALSGCAESFNAKVSRFQSLPAPNGQTFAVEPSDMRLKGGLEFAQYAQLVSAKLVEKGYQPAANDAKPNLVVTMNYSVDHGREKVQSFPSPSYGRFYGGYGGYGGFGGYYGRFGYSPFIYGFYDPFLFGGYNDVRSYTVYTSELDLSIAQADSGKHVFEGTAKAVSSDDELTHLVPNLINAMFTGFPGNSGETVKITIAPPPKSRN